MRKHLLCGAVLALVAPVVFAGGLSKYKNWPNSPQGYFMTNAERAEWKATVKSDDEAEQFIKKFVDSRGPGFAADVAKRAEIADKRLTVSGRAGSLTTRGKIIILLGPPSSFSIAKREIKGHAAFTAESYANLDPTSGPSVGDMAMAANSRNMSGDLLNDYSFTYAGERLPVKQPKDFLVVVEVRAGDGTDRIIDRKSAAQLDELFEAAAQASLAAGKAAAPKP
ncbi:MAG TPA: GWxTD domain-containing protein [Thermoanaerobaculia bacterium]|nr:GWxTD domain-containing protein [Thermoanaerobaculia bacterium]